MRCSEGAPAPHEGGGSPLRKATSALSLFVVMVMQVEAEAAFAPLMLSDLLIGGRERPGRAQLGSWSSQHGRRYQALLQAVRADRSTPSAALPRWFGKQQEEGVTETVESSHANDKLQFWVPCW